MLRNLYKKFEVFQLLASVLESISSIMQRYVAILVLQTMLAPYSNLQFMHSNICLLQRMCIGDRYTIDYIRLND